MCGLQDRAGRIASAGGSEFAGVDDDVVAFAVAEGFGDAEAEGGRFEGEGELAELSTTFGIEFALAGRIGARRAGLLASRPGGHGSPKQKRRKPAGRASISTLYF